MRGIIELEADNVLYVGGGLDHGVVATGLGVMAGGLEIGMARPPAGGVIEVIGLAVAVSGLFS